MKRKQYEKYQNHRAPYTKEHLRDTQGETLLDKAVYREAIIENHSPDIAAHKQRASAKNTR